MKSAATAAADDADATTTTECSREGRRGDLDAFPSHLK
jgi:hypothetical protein